MPIDSERIRRIKQALKENKIDALLCQLPENIVFLSGWWPLTGMTWAIFTADGNCHLIVPACEAQEAKDSGIDEMSTYEWAHLKAHEPAGQIQNHISELAKQYGFETGKIGVEKSFGSVAPALSVGESTAVNTQTWQMLKNALPKANFKDATEMVNALRVSKTPTEIEKLRIANEIATFGLAAFKENAVEGVSEIELAALANNAVMVKGSGYKGTKSARGFAQISSAKGTEMAWRPHVLTTNRKLQQGDIVLLEFGVVADGLWADITRLSVVGKPNGKQEEIHSLILKAQQAAIESIKPGVKMSDVDKAARDIIDKNGYGEYFIHITGHGVGWRYHEFPPLLAPNNDAVLEEGMVTSVEPGVYIPGFGGMRIEDNVAVGKNGADILSTFSREL